MRFFPCFGSEIRRAITEMLLSSQEEAVQIGFGQPYNYSKFTYILGWNETRCSAPWFIYLQRSTIWIAGCDPFGLTEVKNSTEADLVVRTPFLLPTFKTFGNISSKKYVKLTDSRVRLPKLFPGPSFQIFLIHPGLPHFLYIAPLCISMVTKTVFAVIYIISSA